ncbi:hypothetical protein [Duganella sp. FT27W]|uniref:hypothetical protein n=1 Tax=Duganella sp. FT27W TaxID=2654636 RepID=UPI00128CA227|nr:hypothetical protein [Duganella sp. FT27W]MPQ56315.1 hypothetical protein [Duganella sp. FT27W]
MSQHLQVPATPEIEFVNSPDFVRSFIPTKAYGPTITFDGMQMKRIRTSSGITRYAAHTGTRVMASVATYSWCRDRDTNISELTRIELPAGLIFNGEYVEFEFRVVAPMGFGSAQIRAEFGIMPGASIVSPQLMQVSPGATATEFVGRIRMTAMDYNAAKIQDIGSTSPMTFASGGSIRDLSRTVTNTVRLLAQFTDGSQLSKGRYVKADFMSAEIHALSPNPRRSVSNYVDPAERPFNNESFWNIPLVRYNGPPGNLQTASDPETAAMRSLPEGFEAWAGNSVFFYKAKSTDPMQKWNYTSRSDPNNYWPFKSTDYYNGGSLWMNTPVGITAASAGGDKNIGVITPDGRWYVEGINYIYNPDTKEHSVGNMTCHDLYGYGAVRVHERENLGDSGSSVGVRGAGVPLIGGLVRGWELTAGKIDHAIVLILDVSKLKSPKSRTVSQLINQRPVVVNGGSGYRLGEVLVLQGGAATRKAEVTVTKVSPDSGAVLAVWPTNTGMYPANGSGDIVGASATKADSTSTGAGCTISVTMLAALSRSGSRVWPATTVDGAYTEYTNTIPMGSLWTIPPWVDVSSIFTYKPALKSQEAMTLARAIQEYGAYVMDVSEAGAMYMAVCAQDVTTAQFNSLVGMENYVMHNMAAILNNLVMVRNNTPESPGGWTGERYVNQRPVYPLF